MTSGIEIIYSSVHNEACLYAPTDSEHGEAVDVLVDLGHELLCVQPSSTAQGWFPERAQSRLALGVTLDRVPTATGANLLLDTVADAARAAVSATQVYWDPREESEVGFTPHEVVTEFRDAVAQAQQTVPQVRPVGLVERFGTGVVELAGSLGWPFTADLDDRDMHRLLGDIARHAATVEPSGDVLLVTRVLPALEQERERLRELVREDLRSMRARRDDLDARMRQTVHRVYSWGEDSQYVLAEWTGWSQRHIGRIVRGIYLAASDEELAPAET